MRRQIDKSCRYAFSKSTICIFISLSILFGSIVLFPNSKGVNILLDYQLEELGDQVPLKIFKREDNASYGDLVLLQNGRYDDSHRIIYGCMTGVDVTKGPWCEIGKYEIRDNTIFLYPGIIKEQWIYNTESDRMEYSRKFSLPIKWPRKLLIAGEYDSLVEEGNNRIYYLNRGQNQ